MITHAEWAAPCYPAGMAAWMMVVGIGLAVFVLWFIGVFDVIGAVAQGPTRSDAPHAAADPDDPGRAGPVRRSVARGLAIRSRGPGRSLGELQLHPDAVVVVLPTGPVRIPRAEIVAAARTRELFGHPVDHDLLELEWRTASGSTDAAACQVDDLDAWLTALTPAS